MVQSEMGEPVIVVLADIDSIWIVASRYLTIGDSTEPTIEKLASMSRLLDGLLMKCLIAPKTWTELSFANWSLSPNAAGITSSRLHAFLEWRQHTIKTLVVETNQLQIDRHALETCLTVWFRAACFAPRCVFGDLVGPATLTLLAVREIASSNSVSWDRLPIIDYIQLIGLTTEQYLALAVLDHDESGGMTIAWWRAIWRGYWVWQDPILFASWLDWFQSTTATVSTALPAAFK